MIRPFTASDMEAVLRIWLDASVRAHDFVPAQFWQEQLPAMRTVYLPFAQVWVYEDAGQVLGFYALVEDQLAAIFVAPQQQGQGVGAALMQHAKAQRPQLELQVYRDNHASRAFYRAHGWVDEAESVDEATGQVQLSMHWRGSHLP